MAKNGIKASTERRQVERWLPEDGTYSCRSFVVRELVCRDRVDVKVWAQASLPSALAINQADARDFERIEAWRRSLVSVDGEPVNEFGKPYKGMDDWNERTMGILADTFNALNGVEDDELKKIRAGEFSPQTTRPGKSGGQGTPIGAPSAA